MDDWLVIEGFPDYSVNSLGAVRNDMTRRLMAHVQNQAGVVYVGMLDEYGVQRKRSVALLVAKAFMPRPEGLDAFNTPIQIDGDRWNCHVENLMWRPRWFAIQYHQQFHRRYPWPITVPIRDLGDDRIYRDSWEVVTTFGLLEKDLVRSIELRTYVWPTYQQFDLAD